MAKTITDEDIRLSVIVNGNQAQKELLDLDKATRDLSNETKNLVAQRKILEQQGKKGTAEYKALSAAIKENNDTMAANKARMAELQKQIGVTGLSLGQLRQRATVLRATLSGMIPGSKDFLRIQAELAAVNARIREVSATATRAKFSIGALADGFNRYAALGASIMATMAGVVLSIQKVIDINGKLSDAQADVMKTTGLSKKAVDEITKSFGAMKTRTARIELLKLAEEAGRLEKKSVQDVKAFVNVANQMQVALGDDLSTEQIREVGKMVEVYKVGAQTGRDFEGAMLSLGSAINEVAASGSNQAGFLVEYLKRQAGIAAQAKISAANNIGYAATFDEIGQSVEVSATAMNKVWMDMFTEPGNYAKIAGMSVKEFSALLEKDANAAMVKFLKGLNGNEAGFQMMLESLKDLEVGGARGVQALSALAANTDKLEKKQKVANEALWLATSLTNEYNTKNNNLAATIEKVHKTMMGWFSSDKVVNGLTDFFSWFAKLIGATEDLDGSVTRFRDRLMVFLKILTIVITSYISYNAAVKLTLFWTNGLATAQKILTAIQSRGAVVSGVLKSAQLLLSAAYYTATGNITRATAAMRLFNATALTNPFGLILAAIGAVVAALVLFSAKTEEAITAQKVLNDVNKRASTEVDNSRRKLEFYLDVARDVNRSDKERLAAIEAINKEYPELNHQISLENINTDETRAAINRYCTALERKIKLKLIEDKIYESQSRQRDAEKKSLEEYSKWYDGLWSQMTGNTVGAITTKATEALGRRSNDIEAEIELQKGLWDEYKALQEEDFAKTDDPDPTTTGNGKTKLTEEEKRKLAAAAEKARREREKWLADTKKLAEERQRIEREAEDAILANMEDGYRKQYELEQANHKRKIEDYTNRLVELSEIEKAEAKSKNMNLTKEERDFWAEQAANWVENNKHVHSLIESEEYAHKLRLTTIQEKAAKDDISKLKNQYEREKAVRETAFLEELNSLDLSEKEKEAKKKEWQLKELDEEEKFLKELLEKYNEIVSGAHPQFDLSLLTPEQVEEFKQLAEAVGLELAKLLGARDKLNNPESSVDTSAKDLGLSGSKDIFGFTPDNWTTFFDNLKQGVFGVNEMVFAVQALTNMWGQYSSYLAANENAQLQRFEKNADARKRVLKKQLDNGYINQMQYKRGLEKLDKEAEEKRAELAYKQAKRDKQISIASAITGTAQAVVGALGNKPWTPFNFALAGMVAAMGALQLATIIKTPLPSKTAGYEDGLYPDYVTRAQDGKQFRPTGTGRMNRSGLYSKPTILVGEGPGDMPEMIIDKRSFARMDPALRDALIREIRGIKGFEGGYYDSKGTVQVPVQSTRDDSELKAMFQMLMAMIGENTAAIKNLQENGVVGKFLKDDYESIKNLEEVRKRYLELKNNSRR